MIERSEQVIWKYPLDPMASSLVTIPHDARFLHVAMQDGMPHVWALLTPSAPCVRFELVIVGTGHRTPKLYEYVGTVHDAPFVWHIFARRVA